MNVSILYSARDQWKIAWKKQTLSIFWELLFKHEETILNLAEMPVFSPTLASGDQNAMQQHNVFGVRGETRPEKPLLLLLLSPPTHITQSHIGTRSWALFQKTIWYLLSSLPAELLRYPSLRLLPHMGMNGILYVVSKHWKMTFYQLSRNVSFWNQFCVYSG